MIHEKPFSRQQSITPLWKKSLKTAFSDWVALSDYLEISQDQANIIAPVHFPMRIPLSFAKRMKKGDINDPLLAQVLPVQAETSTHPDYLSDPLAEKDFSKMPALLHKYHNRALLILHPACAIHCRYCFRREFDYKAHRRTTNDWQAVFDYLKQHPEIDEVILSGGDPLLHEDKTLQFFLEHLTQIASLKRLRIHSRIPVVLPERITKELLAVFAMTNLEKIMVIHVNHPNEIADDVASALNQLTQAGFSLFNQTTLLKGVNDNAMTLKQLSETLFGQKVIPYYLHALDKVKGAGHFAVSDKAAIGLHKELKAQTSGYLVPKLVREIPHQNSKTWLH